MIHAISLAFTDNSRTRNSLSDYVSSTDILGPRTRDSGGGLPSRLRFYVNGKGVKYITLEDVLKTLLEACSTGVVKVKTQAKALNETEQSRCPTCTEKKCALVEPPICPTVQCPEPVKCPVVKPVKCPVVEPVNCPTVRPVKCPVVEPVKCPRIQPVNCPTVRPVKCPKSSETGLKVKESLEKWGSDVGTVVSEAAVKNVDAKFNKVSNECEWSDTNKALAGIACCFTVTITFLAAMALERTLESKFVTRYTNLFTHPTLICIFMCLKNMTRHRVYVHPLSGKKLSPEDVAKLRKAARQNTSVSENNTIPVLQSTLQTSV